MSLVGADPSPSLDRALEFIGVNHAALIEDIAAGRRVLWLGSGISLREVEGLRGLIRKMLLFLRKTSSGSPDDQHEQALKRIIDNYFPQWIDAYAEETSDWQVPEEDDLPRYIENRYAEILAEPVGDEPPDYLLWEAVDVRQEYGDPELRPGVNHELVATLMLEGLLPHVVSANWDGLIEEAYNRMSGARNDDVSVLMTPDDFRQANGTSSPKLYKIHGCAVRARENSMFRNHLIASKIQIAKWGIEGNPYRRMKSSITNLMTDCPTLILGLSFQDFDLIQTTLTSSEDLGWAWVAQAPAYVVADATLKQGHRLVLEGAYGDVYTRDREQVESASLVPMYAEPVLAALVLRVVSLKIVTLLRHVGELREGSAVYTALILAMERREVDFAGGVDADYGRVAAFLIGALSPLIHRFHGQDPLGGYVSIQQGSLAILQEGSETKRTGAPNLAALLALVNLVAYGEDIQIRIGDGGEFPGVIEMSRKGEASQYLVPVKDDLAVAAIYRSETWRNSEKRIVLVRPAGRDAPRPRRSPATTLGQGRKPGARRHEVSVEQIWTQQEDPSRVSKDFLRVVTL